VRANGEPAAAGAHRPAIAAFAPQLPVVADVHATTAAAPPHGASGGGWRTNVASALAAAAPRTAAGTGSGPSAASAVWSAREIAIRSGVMVMETRARLCSPSPGGSSDRSATLSVVPNTTRA
jgi:hypothetical protein